jgi:hypothetical protein
LNDNFENRLRTLLVANDDPPASERFDTAVSARIARLRRLRQVMRPVIAVAASVVVAMVVAPLFAPGATFVAEAPAMLNGALGALIASPLGYALGALTAVAALVDAFRR